MLLSHDEILGLLSQGVVENSKPEHVNGTSLDITMGKSILTERPFQKVVDYGARKSGDMMPVQLDERGYLLKPGEFILAGSQQVFSLPLDLSAEYKLKSSMARIGLQHLNAGWCDPGWNHSVLTMELVNVTRFSSILVKPGDRIGQMVFFRHKYVERENSYAVRGRYNGDGKVHELKL